MENNETEQRFFMKPSEIVELFKKYELEKKDTKMPVKDKTTANVRVKSYDGLPLMERCQMVLGRRMTERRGVGYLLDGVHVSCERIIKEAGL